MPNSRIQRYDTFQRGTNLAVEPERLSPVEFKRAINIDIARDGLPETADGYAIEFELDKSRQIATMEDSEDTEWAGDAADEPQITPVKRQNFGFQSRKHAHTSSDTADTSTYTPSSGFLDFIKEFQDDELTAGDVKFRHWIQSDDVSEISTLEIRYRKDGSNYFSITGLIPAADDVGELFTNVFTDFSTTGALTWDEVVDVQIITTPIGSNLAHDVMFDDFFLEDGEQSEPITGLYSFEVPIKGTSFLMVSTSDMIYSVVGITPTKRAAGLGRQRPVHFATGNDYVFAANDNDILQRWDPDEPSFRDTGVPAPPSGMTGAGIDASAPDGNVTGGSYSSKVTFDMGQHGEGNPSSQTSTFVVSSGQDAIQYDGIPIGPPGTVRRIIYRSAEGSGVDGPAAIGPWFLDIIIPDNTTTAAAASTISRISNASILASAQVQTDGAQPVVLKYIAEASSTLFGVPKDRPSRIRHSDITRQPNRTIEQWDELNEIDIDPDDGDIITGLLKHKEYLYPFKRLSSFLVNPTQLVAQKISAIYGAISQRVLHDAGEKAYFWSARFGPMRLVGNRIDEIGKNLRDIEGRPLGVTGINENVLVPETKTQSQKHEITAIADWQLGSFTNMTATASVGSIENTRGVGSDTVDQANSSLGATITEALSGPLTASRDAPSALIDGNAATGLRGFDKEPASSTAVGTVIHTIDVPDKTYNRINLGAWFHEAGFGSLKVEVIPTLGPTVIVANYTTWGSVPLPIRSVAGGWASDSYRYKTGRWNINVPNILGDQIRITYKTSSANISGAARAANQAVYFLGEIQAFEQAFIANGEWESEDINLGSASITAFNNLIANFDLNGGNVVLQMKTGSTGGNLASANYIDISPTGPPLGITPEQFVKIRVRSTAVGANTPRIHDITLSFSVLETEILGTLVESNGIFFEDKSWFNLVQRDLDTPNILWKVGFFEESMEHGDYQMSCWAIHRGALFSGSALDGKVYRHVRDANGVRLPNKDGRPMVTEMEPSNNALGEQAIEKSVRDWLLTARNESERFPNLFLNPDFEEVLGGTDPLSLGSSLAASWGQNAAAPIRTARLVSIDNDRINVFSKKISMSLDARQAGPTEIFFEESVSLTNDTDYRLKFFAKNLGPQAQIRITTADGLILASDGTWVATNPDIVFNDSGGIYVLHEFGFRTLTDIEDRGPVEIRFLYPATTTALQGITYFDLMELKQVQTRDRKLEVIPVIDGVDQLPPRIIDLVAGRDGIVKARGRIDRAGVRNVSYRIRTQGVDSGFKFMGLVTSFAPERVRSGG